jgi:hypothetical protein
MNVRDRSMEQVGFKRQTANRQRDASTATFFIRVSLPALAHPVQLRPVMDRALCATRDA